MERESIADYVKEGESLASLHFRLRACDTVLQGVESSLRAFKSDLGQVRTLPSYSDGPLASGSGLSLRSAACSEVSLVWAASFYVGVTPILLPLLGCGCDTDASGVTSMLRRGCGTALGVLPFPLPCAWMRREVSGGNPCGRGLGAT